jgi:two-component system phosphate regulon sensor histidine kinase PhoR
VSAAAIGLALATSRYVSFELALVAAVLLAAATAGVVRLMVDRRLSPITHRIAAIASRDFSVHGHVGDGVDRLSLMLDQMAAVLDSDFAALRSQRDLVSDIVDNLQEGILIVDAEDRIVRVNPALRDTLLLPVDTAGRPLLEVVQHAELKDLLAQAHEGSHSAEVEITGLKPRRLRVRAQPLATAGLRLAVLIDVTDIRRLETMRRDFVANVSHELRTPVTAIRSAAETLRMVVDNVAIDDGADRADAHRDTLRFVEILERNAERLHLLIEDLLELSRIEGKEFQFDRESIEVRALLQQMVLLFRDRAEKRGVTFYVDAPEGLRFVSDRRAIEQIVANLIDNAVKYCPDGLVELRATSDGSEVTLEISDQGTGIHPKHLPRIFERFYRIDKGRSRDVGGTGLGLAIVKNLVEALGGTVGVQSRLGEGTTFKCAFRLDP